MQSYATVNTPWHTLTSSSAVFLYFLYSVGLSPTTYTIAITVINDTPIISGKYLHHRAELEKCSISFSKISNQDAALFITAICSAGNKHIPRTKKTIFIQKKEFHGGIISWQTLKANPIQPNLILYRKTNARFRQELNKAKRENFENFTKTIRLSIASGTKLSIPPWETKLLL